jgi:hypothetical protein
MPVTVVGVQRLVIPAEEWQAHRAAHEERVDAWTGPHLDRARRGEKHPVHDFLFTYYRFRPAQLRRWHPGFGVVLAGAPAREFLTLRGYVDTADGVALGPAALTEWRLDTARFVHDLMQCTAARPAQFGCFGLHEWAMLYRQDQREVRHSGWPLRLGPSGVAQVVEGQPLRCTHFDAYRFFTDPARPLNVHAPSRERVLDLEQGGCLHANMDLYKWAYQLSPLVPSELVADAFELARDIRELDMRASPYDLSGLGYEPVRIETPDGKAGYAAAQREFARRAAVLRRRLDDDTGRLVSASLDGNVSRS